MCENQAFGPRSTVSENLGLKFLRFDDFKEIPLWHWIIWTSLGKMIHQRDPWSKVDLTHSWFLDTILETIPLWQIQNNIKV